MIRNIYLHVGLHKTASTSIQFSLGVASDLLKNNGFLYPLFFIDNRVIRNHSVPMVIIIGINQNPFHFNANIEISSGKSLSELKLLFRDQLMNQISAFNGENLIISGEGLSRLNEAELIALKQLFYDTISNDVEIHLVVFVRNPISKVQSSIQQRVHKSGDVLEEISQLLIYKSEKFYYSFFSKMFHVFPECKMHVVRFEDAIKHPFGPVGMFASIVGIEKTLFANFKIIHANKSISNEAVRLISAVNRENKEKILTSCEIERLSLAKIPGNKFVLTSSQRNEIWRLTEVDCKWLSDRFLIEKYNDFKEDSTGVNERWGEDSLNYLHGILSSHPKSIQRIILIELFNEIELNIEDITMIKLEQLSRFIKKNDFFNQLSFSCKKHRNMFLFLLPILRCPFKTKEIKLDAISKHVFFKKYPRYFFSIRAKF
jgi:hypothetical protein